VLLIRFILLALLFYLVSKIFVSLFSSGVKEQSNKVHGDPHNRPLDLSEQDVEDVNYRDMPRDK